MHVEVRVVTIGLQYCAAIYLDLEVGAPKTRIVLCGLGKGTFLKCPGS